MGCCESVQARGAVRAATRQSVHYLCYCCLRTWNLCEREQQQAKRSGLTLQWLKYCSGQSNQRSCCSCIKCKTESISTYLNHADALWTVRLQETHYCFALNVAMTVHLQWKQPSPNDVFWHIYLDRKSPRRQARIKLVKNGNKGMKHRCYGDGGGGGYNLDPCILL